VDFRGYRFARRVIANVEAGTGEHTRSSCQSVHPLLQCLSPPLLPHSLTCGDTGEAPVDGCEGVPSIDEGRMEFTSS
jgi:hypothetical protein